MSVNRVVHWHSAVKMEEICLWQRSTGKVGETERERKEFARLFLSVGEIKGGLCYKILNSDLISSEICK